MSNSPEQPALNSLSKSFEPAALEAHWGPEWERRGYGVAGHRGTGQPQAGQPGFAIQLPPPNVTGELHVGHALTVAVEDLLIRWHRMLGDDTLWLPGVDHAAIAVQNVVERELRREGAEQQVRGLGVVGAQPVLKPGESFEYTSGTAIATPVGTMQGSYQMVAEDGERFDAFVDRVGHKTFEGLLADLREVGPVDSNYNLYEDWERQGLYKLERGEGECAV